MAWELVQESELPDDLPEGADQTTSPLEPEAARPPKPPDPPGFKYVWR